jgi:hypothetical protein
MPTEAGSNPLTQSTAGTWIARWTAGAALGQIVFGGTVRLVFAVALGALLGGVGVWLVQRHRTTRAQRPDPIRRPAQPGYRRPMSPRPSTQVPLRPSTQVKFRPSPQVPLRSDAQAWVRRVQHPRHTGGRMRYSPLAPDAQWQQSDREHVER